MPAAGLLLAGLLAAAAAAPAGAWWSTVRRLSEDPGDDDTLSDLPSNCDVVEVGCYKDGCDGSECRSLEYGIPGCSGHGTTPAPTPGPTCDQPSLTNEICVKYCYDWFKDDESPVVFGGTNNGECYCSLDYDPGGPKNGGCDVACPADDTGCAQPCAGDPSEMCGGEWFNMIYKIECGGWSWAWPFIYGIAISAVVYTFLGTGMRLSTGGGVGPPNPEFWGSLSGLVGDGIAFTMGHHAGGKDGLLPTRQAGVTPLSSHLAPQSSPAERLPTMPTMAVHRQGHGQGMAASAAPSSAMVVASTPEALKVRRKKVVSGEKVRRKKDPDGGVGGGGSERKKKKKVAGPGGDEKKKKKKKKPSGGGAGLME